MTLFYVVITFIADVSSFDVIVLGIRPLHYGLWLVHLFCSFMRGFVFHHFKGGFVLQFMDSSIVFGRGFIHCLRANSSTLITGDLPPLY